MLLYDISRDRGSDIRRNVLKLVEKVQATFWTHGRYSTDPKKTAGCLKSTVGKLPGTKENVRQTHLLKDASNISVRSSVVFVGRKADGASSFVIDLRVGM